MALFDRERKALSDAAVALRDEIEQLKAERAAREKALDLTKDVVSLKRQLTDLEIQKAKITEDNARERREVTHMVGLERKRQEFEAEQARKEIETARAEALLKVREENLTAERKAFEKSMKFREERFVEEVGYLKDLMGQILGRLPTVTVDRTIEERTATGKGTR
jgi:hypothetical protein